MGGVKCYSSKENLKKFYASHELQEIKFLCNKAPTAIGNWLKSSCFLTEQL